MGYYNYNRWKFSNTITENRSKTAAIYFNKDENRFYTVSDLRKKWNDSSEDFNAWISDEIASGSLRKIR